ncbi:MAG: phosphopentomutase, partial [Clostridiales bacterium]|nr:phosphopentomutase [Clostridiales bacterium]
MKRVFLIVLDSVGAGEAPDADKFGDRGAHTLLSVSRSPYCKIENLCRAGIGNIDGLDFFGKTDTPFAAVAKMTEASAGKDTTIGHWEIAGLRSKTPLPTFSCGFPEEIIAELEKAIGRKMICNKPYSGTEVIKDYGEEHIKTGALIVYTSADSVFQIAAHDSVVDTETLYEYCRIARKILSGKYTVGRVIARPFAGDVGSFYRTANRRDFSLEPTGTTLLDALKDAGKDVIAVGKISDIFAGRGITRAILT